MITFVETNYHKKMEKKQRPQPLVKDPNRVCSICNLPYMAVAPMQKTCSKECRKTKDRIARKEYHKNNPEKHREYNAKRLTKDPNAWKDKWTKERLDILDALGGVCIVCGNDNPYHLHVDYIPTMVGTGYRHPRHRRWVLDHLSDFRILCANHHYELTLSGKIKGTTITQVVSNPRTLKRKN